MQDELERLLTLQEVDDQLKSLHDSRVDLPRKIEKLEGEINLAEGEIAAGERKIEELKRERRRVELNLAVSNEELKRYQQQLYSIKTNKEYDALQHEIAREKEKISQLEDRILNLMAEIEELEEISREGLQNWQEVENEKVERLETMRQELDSLEDKIVIKEEERKKVAVRIEKRNLAIYERISKGKQGLAVVGVKKGACGGCFRALPPQKIQEIRRRDKIITCESCGRILVWIEG